MSGISKIYILIALCFFSCESTNVVERYENGNLKERGKLLNGKKEGKWYYFAENGDTVAVHTFREDLKHGMSFGYENGHIKNKREYKKGIQNGLYIDYYNNGNLELIGQMKEGKQHGKWVFYYPDGQVLRKFELRQGKPVSDFYSYYRNGQIEFTGNYQDSTNAFLYDSIGNKIGEFKTIDGAIADTLFLKQVSNK